MRHNKKFNHLSRKSAHRDAMLANMTISLIMHKRIITTLAKAKPHRAASSSSTSRTRRPLRNFTRPLLLRSVTAPVATPASSSSATVWVITLRPASSSSSTSTRHCSRPRARRRQPLRRLPAAAARKPLPLLPQPRRLLRPKNNSLLLRNNSTNPASIIGAGFVVFSTTDLTVFTSALPLFEAWSRWT